MWLGLVVKYEVLHMRLGKKIRMGLGLLTCMAMCWSGARTGTTRPTTKNLRDTTPVDRTKDQLMFCVVGRGPVKLGIALLAGEGPLNRSKELAVFV